MTRPTLSTLAACIALTACAISYQIGAKHWRENAQYAARLAVAVCRTDTECQTAGDVADEYGALPSEAYARDSWTD